MLSSSTASLTPKGKSAGGRLGESNHLASSLPHYPRVWSLGNLEECAVYLFYHLGNGKIGLRWENLSQNSRRRWRNKVRASLPDSKVVG